MSRCTLGGGRTSASIAAVWGGGSGSAAASAGLAAAGRPAAAAGRPIAAPICRGQRRGEEKRGRRCGGRVPARVRLACAAESERPATSTWNQPEPPPPPEPTAAAVAAPAAPAAPGGCCSGGARSPVCVKRKACDRSDQFSSARERDRYGTTSGGGAGAPPPPPPSTLLLPLRLRPSSNAPPPTPLAFAALDAGGGMPRLP